MIAVQVTSGKELTVDYLCQAVWRRHSLPLCCFWSRCRPALNESVLWFERKNREENHQFERALKKTSTLAFPAPLGKGGSFLGEIEIKPT